MQVIGDANLARHHDVFAGRAAAGDADLRADQVVAADAAVVADLHEVVDLRAAADDGGAVGAAVDRRARADFDVIADFDIAELGAELVAAIDGGVAEAVSAEHRAGVNDDVLAEQRCFRRGRRLGKRRQLAPIFAAVEDANAAVNDRACADFDIVADKGLRMYFDAIGDAGRGADVCRGADAAEMRLPRRMEMGDDLAERRMNIVDGDERTVGRLKLSRNDDSRSFAAGQLRREAQDYRRA